MIGRAVSEATPHAYIVAINLGRTKIMFGFKKVALPAKDGTDIQRDAVEKKISNAKGKMQNAK